MAPVFIPSRLQDAGGFQHYRPDIRWDEWCIHGAGLLQQLHCLQAAQGFLPKPAHQVRAEAKEFLCVSNRGSVSLTMCIFPSPLALSPVHYNPTQPTVIIYNDVP